MKSRNDDCKVPKVNITQMDGWLRAHQQKRFSTIIELSGDPALSAYHTKGHHNIAFCANSLTQYGPMAFSECSGKCILVKFIVYNTDLGYILESTCS